MRKGDAVSDHVLLDEVVMNIHRSMDPIWTARKRKTKMMDETFSVQAKKIHCEETV